MRHRRVEAVAAGAWLVLGAFLVHRAEAQSACGVALGSGIYAKWITTGGESGFLGCPIGPEVEAASSPRGTTGRFAEFRGGDGGFVVWHGSGPLRDRSFEIHGCIFKLYKSVGGTASWLGFPVSDERDAPGGRLSDFEGGAIAWDARTRECRAERRNAGGDGSKGGGGGGICADPRTLGFMDEWLARAVPSQQPGKSLRYDAWGRLVGQALTTSGPPDTPLTRCEWLWARAADLRSANRLGTLQEFVEQRVHGMV